MIDRRRISLLFLMAALGCGGGDDENSNVGGGAGSAGAGTAGSSTPQGGSTTAGGVGGTNASSGSGGSGAPSLGAPFVPTRLASLDRGNCVVTKSQILYCWGKGAPTTSELKYTQVSAQFDQTCAILADGDAQPTGNVWCFGAKLNASTPPGTFEEVRVSQHSACARNAQNLLTCWTDGDATVAPIVAGVPKEPVKNFYLMEDTACAVMQTGAVKCWGWDLVEYPRLVPKRSDYLVLGGYHELFGIGPDAAISGWGLTAEPPSPPGKDYVQLAVGEDHFAALHSSGLVSSIGQDAATAPMGVEFVEISAGVGQTCGITKAGTVTCWGKGTDPEFKAPPDAVQIF